MQSAVDARREGDENPNSGVVAETMKLLANSSYGYQIMAVGTQEFLKLNKISQSRKLCRKLSHSAENESIHVFIH